MGKGEGGEGEEMGERMRRLMNCVFRKVNYTDDSYEAVERRRWAATILDCPELLMMHAQARQDVRLPPSPPLPGRIAKGVV